VKFVEIHWTLHPDKAQGLYYDETGKPRSPWYDSYITDRNLTPSAVARELDLCDELSVEGVVYPEFRKSHIYTGPPIINPYKPVVRVLDYGGCFAVLFGQKDDYGGANIFKEIVVLKDGNAHMMGQMVQAYSSDLKCMGFSDHDDPAGSHDGHISGTTSAQIIRQYGINPTHFHSVASNQRKKDRTEMIHHKLMERVGNGREAVQIHESCTTLIDAFQNGYRYLEKKTGEIDIDVIDERHPYEDVIDCFGMFLMEEFTVSNDAGPIPQIHIPRGNKYTGY
jgi:hypothetical protein